jgi:Lrp/AsnC family transcriptional regulator for asnA, asnC and gidA
MLHLFDKLFNDLIDINLTYPFKTYCRAPPLYFILQCECIWLTYEGIWLTYISHQLNQYYYILVIELKNMNIKPNILDYINCRILDVLSKNSSLPFVELAKQIGISDATIHTRVRKLLTLGIIKKFTIFVDNDLLGYDHLAFINLKIEKGRTEETTTNLMEIDEVLEIHEIYDKFDLLIKIRTKNLDNLRDIIVNKILSINYVKETELMTVLRTRKEEQMISLQKEMSETTKEFF